MAEKIQEQELDRKSQKPRLLVVGGYWIFEGKTGGQYSARSVQNIMKDA